MKTIRSERGQSLVELAISLVLLLVLLSGAVEFGIAFFQFVQLRDAAQEGALYGSMNPTDCTNIVSRIKGASNSPVDLNGTGVTITTKIVDDASGTEYDCGSVSAQPYDCEGNGLKVTITYDHKIFMPFLPAILGKPTLALKATVTDTILSPVC
jgi:Flp pilus assembly protein TadG